MNNILSKNTDCPDAAQIKDVEFSMNKNYTLTIELIEHYLYSNKN